MICKFCQTELNEDQLICPACGRNQEEPQEVAAEEASVKEPEVKAGITVTPGKIALFVVGCVVLFAVVVGLVVSFMSGARDQKDPTAPTDGVPEETVVYTVPADGKEGTVTQQGSYTGADEEVIAANNEVVATIGQHSLTNGQLQAYYWGEVVNFLQQYGSYISMFGLDLNYGLDTQLCALYEEPVTWQQYFLETALGNWSGYVALKLESEATGFEPNEDFKKYLEDLPKTLEETAEDTGAESTIAMIQEVAGAGCTLQDYIDYVTLYNIAYLYYDDCYNKIDPTDAEIEAYFAKNEAAYEESGVTRDSGLAMDVRHILLQPENGVADESGYYMTYSDEDWAACEAKAQALLDQWKAGEATEESFAALAEEHTADGGSQQNGGLYTGLTEETNFVESFKAWYMDESRKTGDTGLVKSEHGWHIMYFSGSQELWKSTARADLIDEKSAQLVPQIMDKYPAMSVDYGAIVLGLIELM